ncbi:MAG TPA: hypothetical protein VFV58_10440 [Blastocatellia bacterium]|nr:hypothetical protein [Blastocatellia bacterium]
MLKQVITYSLILLFILFHPLIGISSQQNPSGTDSPPSTGKEIRNFNFLNRTYFAECADRKVKVRNGSYQPGPNSSFFFTFEVSVSFGDLTGDGVEEALVVTQCAGAAQNFSTAKVYAVQDHRLVKLAQLRHGAKNDGDILEGKISKGRVIVKRLPDNSPSERCSETKTITYNMQENRLRQVRTICGPD